MILVQSGVFSTKELKVRFGYGIMICFSTKAALLLLLLSSTSFETSLKHPTVPFMDGGQGSRLGGFVNDISRTGSTRCMLIRLLTKPCACVFFKHIVSIGSTFFLKNIVTARILLFHCAFPW